MYQTPTRNRPAAQPAAPPKFMLAGRQVTQSMYYAAQEAKRARQRCFLITAEESYIENERVKSANCANCEGYGRLGLEIVVGGPFEGPPTTGERGEGVSKIHLSIAWHNGWFQVVRSYCDCPVCGSTREIML